MSIAQQDIDRLNENDKKDLESITETLRGSKPTNDAPQEINPAKKTIKEGAKAKIQDRYKADYDVDLDEKAVENLIIYHQAIRSGFNDLFSLATIADDVSLNNAANSATASAIPTILEGIPVVGNFVGAAAEIARIAIDSKLTTSQLQNYHKILELNPSHDQGEWSKFSKDLATELADDLVSTTKSPEEIGKMTKKELQDLAKSHHAKIISSVLKGEFKDKQIDGIESGDASDAFVEDTNQNEAIAKDMASKAFSDSKVFHKKQEKTTPSPSPTPKEVQQVQVSRQQVHTH